MPTDLKPAGLADLSCMFGTDEAEATASHLICPRFGCEKDTIIIVSPQRDTDAIHVRYGREDTWQQRRDVIRYACQSFSIPGGRRSVIQISDWIEALPSSHSVAMTPRFSKG
ncbi:hypothetical protein KM043_018372 [Ampulex compressa]|nr:hypothetical protein KM043_018372 [Ampulex compressa]